MSEIPAWADEWDGEPETLAPHIEELRNDWDDHLCEALFATKFEAFWHGYAKGREDERQEEAATDRATRG